MYLNFSNFWGRTSAGGRGRALVQNGYKCRMGGIGKIFAGWGNPPSPPQENNPVCVVTHNKSNHKMVAAGNKADDLFTLRLTNYIHSVFHPYQTVQHCDMHQQQPLYTSPHLACPPSQAYRSSRLVIHEQASFPADLACPNPNSRPYHHLWLQGSVLDQLILLLFAYP